MSTISSNWLHFATIEARQIMLALWQLAMNTKSANFNNNSIKVSKLPSSLTTTSPTLDGKSETLELFAIFSKLASRFTTS